jgi:hypothetical protein
MPSPSALVPPLPDAPALILSNKAAAEFRQKLIRILYAPLGGEFHRDIIIWNDFGHWQVGPGQTTGK